LHIVLGTDHNSRGEQDKHRTDHVQHLLLVSSADNEFNYLT
jgi:hypothetical protein